MKIVQKDECRICQNQPETIDHTQAACTIIAKEEYIKRHDRICLFLHCKVSKTLKVPKPARKWCMNILHNWYSQ